MKEYTYQRMLDDIIVGSYSKRRGAYLKKTTPLLQVSFEYIRPFFIGEPCPYDYEIESENYQNYKSNHLHLLYFSTNKYRPSTYDINPYASSTNWFVLDVDRFTDYTKAETYELIKANCPPFVRFVQQTGKGLHLWCFCDLNMKCEDEWLSAYDHCATEVYQVIKTPFDINCRSITQGTYIWHQDESNNYDNPNFCTSSSFSFAEVLPKEVLYGQIIDDTKEKLNIQGDSNEDIANINIDPRFLEDYYKLNMNDLLLKYKGDFEVCFESKCNYSYITTYWGETILAYRTNKQHYRVFTPTYYDYKKHKLLNRKLEDGQRRKKYLFCTGCAIMNIKPSTTIEELLYNMVYYFLHYVDNSKDVITKKKLYKITKEAFVKHSWYHTEVLDERKWIIGEENVLDQETGLSRPKTVGEKLSEAQKLRKNDKVKKVMALIDTNLSVRENREQLKCYGLKISESYLRKILNEVGALPTKKKSKRVSAYRVSDGKRLSVPKELVDGKNYVKSKRELLK